MSTQSYLVFLDPVIIPSLKAMGIFLIVSINNCDYIACSKIQETYQYLELTVLKGHLWNHLDHDILISIPNRYVMYTCTATGQDLQQTPGFRKQ